MTTGPLTHTELRDLRALVAEMIPASEAYKVPGADDEAIFADVVNSLERDAQDARASLRLLFALNRVVLLCYYRDDRVMRSLGQEPRPPFPKGHVVEQGDWSLLDPVKKRAPFWRPA